MRDFTFGLLIIWVLVMAAFITNEAQAASVSVYEDTLFITGNIELGDSSKVIVLKETFEINTVLLMSNGGVAREGVAMAYIVHSMGVETVATEYCVSACAMIWLAGKNRIAFHGAQVLQHGIYTLEGENIKGPALVFWNKILTQLYNTIEPTLTVKLIKQLTKPQDQYIKLHEIIQ